MAKNQRFQTVANGLDKLKEAVKDLKLQVPRLRELPSLAQLGATVEGKIQAVSQIQEGVENALKFLAEVRAQVSKYNDNRLARKIVVEESSRDVAEMQEYLDSVLTLDDKIFRQAAGVAYLKTVLSAEFQDYDEAANALRDLETRGLLVKAAGKEGPILVGYQRYTVSEKFGLEKEDLAEINETVAKFSRTLMGLVSQRRQEQTKEVQQEVDISLQEALAGKNGKCLLEVPAESYVDRRDGKEKWRGGGSLLVDFRGKEVLPILGIGSIENAVVGMAKADIRLPRYTLEWETPPGSGDKAFKRVQAGVMETLGLNAADAEAYINKMKALWHLIRRAVRSLQDREAMAKLREEFQRKADLTPAEFFGFNGRTHHGIACLEFQGAFRQKAGQASTYNLFFLATRCQKVNKEIVEVTEVPPHLQDVLGGFVGKSFPAEDNFTGCPGQLGRILRGIRGQIDLASETAKE